MSKWHIGHYFPLFSKDAQYSQNIRMKSDNVLKKKEKDVYIVVKKMLETIGGLKIDI